MPRLPVATDDDEAQSERWRHATLEERGAALYALLRFVDATGRFPAKGEMFPGWKSFKRQT